MRIGFLIFPGLTQLDVTGPYEVLARLPGAEIHLLWKNGEPVRTEHGLALIPTTILEACPSSTCCASRAVRASTSCSPTARCWRS